MVATGERARNRRTRGGHTISYGEVVAYCQSARKTHGETEVVLVRGRDLRRFDLEDERAAQSGAPKSWSSRKTRERSDKEVRRRMASVSASQLTN